MRKKISHKEEHDEEIWHIVYLDFVTSMMILFMAMWAANQVASKKGRDANVKTGEKKFDGKTFALGQASLLPEFRDNITKWNDEFKDSVFGQLGTTEDESRIFLKINGHASKDDIPDLLSNHKKNMQISVERALNVYLYTADDLARKVADKNKLDKMLSNVSVCGHSFNFPVITKEQLMLSPNKTSDLKTELSRNQRITFEVSQTFKDEMADD